MSAQRSAAEFKAGPVLAVLLLLALLAGMYTSTRYGGWASEGDARVQAVIAESILANRSLEKGEFYYNGFAYGALLAIVSQISGISPYQLVIWGNIWFVVVALVAFITYRELLGEARLAALSTLLLFLIPDFLFYVLRGGHERVTWMLALLMVFLLARSLRHAGSPFLLLAHILGFYLIFWAMASTNIYFASTFVTAISFSLVGALVLGFLNRSKLTDEVRRENLLRRLLTITLACLVLVFIFMAYTYKPALSFFFQSRDLVTQAGLLVLGVQQSTAPASFTYVGQAWVSRFVYLALVVPQFLIAGTSFGSWLANLRKQYFFDDHRWLLWWFYAAFGFLLVVGTLADFSGFLSQNLQMRMFTPFALFIAPLAALVVRAAFTRLHRRMPGFTHLYAGVFLVYGLLAAMLKVTNDPAVSNGWLFYTPAELRAGQWMNAHIQNQEVWVDTWTNLPGQLESVDGYNPDLTVAYVAGGFRLPPPYILITEKTLLRANRIGYVLPSTGDRQRVYDNGSAWLYYRRPSTIYQR